MTEGNKWCDFYKIFISNNPSSIRNHELGYMLLNLCLWIENAYATPQFSSDSKHQVPTLKKLLSASEAASVTENKVQTSLNPMRSIKGTPSSVAIGKRKRQDEKLKVISKEEAAALKAREAAKKRVEEMEKLLLGLYRPFLI
ncbi:hypothetical protein RGQ29_005508 [Quercus rubra]|uniref:Uncharacterized protein n=1 Tax=Quercus rubra TaxID=3512 RepID=A0AAN7E4F2_QUERU|nr:hypothetical protein RGQ29_005508 [Quercus rubra]